MTFTPFNSTSSTRTKVLKSFNAWADSGASSILIAHKDAHNIPTVRPRGGHRVQVASGDIMTSVGSSTMTPVPGLSLPVHVYPPDTLTHSLCGLAPFTRQGCSVTFTDTDVRIEKDGQIVMQGTKSPGDTLWPLPLTFTELASPAEDDGHHSHHSAMLAIANQSNAEYVRFSPTFGSPPVPPRRDTSDPGLDSQPA